MKKLVKVVVLGMVIVPIAFLGGCAKKCCEPVYKHKVEEMREECGGGK